MKTTEEFLDELEQEDNNTCELCLGLGVLEDTDEEGFVIGTEKCFCMIGDEDFSGASDEVGFANDR